MAKPVKRVREIVQTPETHEPEEVFDDEEQVIKADIDRDEDLTEAVTTAALAMPPGLISTERKMTQKMEQTGKTIGGQKMSHDKTGAAETSLKDLGKEWPRKQKNTGGQQPAGGMGHTKKEEYSPEGIADLITDDIVPLQEIFDAYATSSGYVSLPEFNEVCTAYGHHIATEQTLVHLMAVNKKFMFTEQEDAQGRYWMVEDHGEGEEEEEYELLCPKCDKHPCVCPKEAKFDGPCPKCHQDPCECEMCSECGECPCACPGKNEKKKSKKPWEDTEISQNTITEARPGQGPRGGYGYQVHDPYAKTHLDVDDWTEDELAKMAELEPEDGPPYEAEEGPPQETGEGPYQGCPECGAMMDELGCPECGYSEDEMSMAAAIPGRPGRPEMGESKGKKDKTILEYDNVAMSGPPGKGVVERTGKGGKESGLPKTKTDTQEMGKEWPRKQKNVGGSWEETGQTKHAEAGDSQQKEMMRMGLGEKQKNTGGSWEKFEGGGAGKMTGGAKKMYENVSRLAKYVQETIKEFAKESKLSKGCYQVSFAVSAGDSVKPKVSGRLMEALADVEELLQVNETDQVSLEARFCNSNNQIVAKRLVPLIQVAERGPIVVEGRILFRFPEVARDFADVLVSEGKTCRAITDNWGAAVTAKIPMSLAMSAYQAIKEAHLPGPSQHLRSLIDVALREMKRREDPDFYKLEKVLESEKEDELVSYVQDELVRDEYSEEDIPSLLKLYLGKLAQEEPERLSPEEQDEFFGKGGRPGR